MKREIQVLDATMMGGEHPVLLDGKGGCLRRGAEPVWLTFRMTDCWKARNSRGELFSPNITPWHFVQSDGTPDMN